jgi:opacity protein-like surface antigen
MNRHFAIALVLATAAVGNAFADDITVEATPFQSTMSRAEVQADMQQARASRIDPWAQDYDQLAAFRSERSRADVTAEYTADRDSVAAFNGEDSGSVKLASRDLPAPIAHIAAAE